MISSLDVHSRMDTRGPSRDIWQASTSKQAPVELSALCRCEKISSLFSSFDGEKANIVQSIGFGGLLKLPMIAKLDLNLCLWLYRIADFSNKCLRLTQGPPVYFDAPDVHLVMDIPFGTKPVQCNMQPSSQTISAFIERFYCDGFPDVITTSYLEEILKRDYGAHMSFHEKECFSIACVMYACTYLMAPQPRHRFPIYLIENFVGNLKPGHINWCQFVIDELGRASDLAQLLLNRNCKQIELLGCCMFRQVFYLDNLNFGPKSPYHSFLPRSSAYLPDIVADMVAFDFVGQVDNELMVFGRTEVRPSYDVIYTRGWPYHRNMVHDMQRLCANDYLNSVQMVSQAMHLLDRFALQTKQLTQHDTNQCTQAMQDLVDSYLAYQSKFNGVINKLSTKAADYIKMVNLNSFPGYLPQHLSISADSQKCNALSGKQIMNTAEWTGKLEDRAGCSYHPQQVSSQRNMFALPDLAVSSAKPRQSRMFGRQLATRKIVESHSNFPMSPFALHFPPHLVEFQDKHATFKWMADPYMSSDQLNLPWVIFEEPKLLSIPGYVVKDCLRENGEFTVTFVDAIMVLWDYLDKLMYTYHRRHGHAHKRWRHFLPASFADNVYHNLNVVHLDDVRASFIGDHIQYDVEDCQKIIIPVFSNRKKGSWSCYFWDFKDKTITVLDPMLMKSSIKQVEKKHANMVIKLHQALFACIQYFFAGWDTASDGWTHIYKNDFDTSCNAENSGLLAVHYARSFSGSDIAFSLTGPNEDTLCEARGELLYLLMKCRENKARA